jgi:DNA-binding MarR family transcriptional regulator
MTGLIDTLERDGFVRRQPDPDDRRMMSVRLTARAEKFLHRFLPGHFKAIGAMMGPLSESDRKTLVRLLGKIQLQTAALNGAPAAAAKLAAHN